MFEKSKKLEAHRIVIFRFQTVKHLFNDVLTTIFLNHQDPEHSGFDPMPDAESSSGDDDDDEDDDYDDVGGGTRLSDGADELGQPNFIIRANPPEDELEAEELLKDQQSESPNEVETKADADADAGADAGVDSLETHNEGTSTLVAFVMVS